MISSSGDSASTSTSNRLRRSSTPASAIGSRTRTRYWLMVSGGRDGAERLERRGRRVALSAVRPRRRELDLDRGERAGDLLDRHVAYVPDAEELRHEVAMAAGDRDPVPVAKGEPERDRVDSLGCE